MKWLLRGFLHQTLYTIQVRAAIVHDYIRTGRTRRPEQSLTLLPHAARFVKLHLPLVQRGDKLSAATFRSGLRPTIEQVGRHRVAPERDFEPHPLGTAQPTRQQVVVTELERMIGEYAVCLSAQEDHDSAACRT